MKHFFLIQWHKVWFLHHRQKWANIRVETAERSEESTHHFQMGWEHGKKWQELDPKGHHKFARREALRAFNYDIDAPNA
jgi:hypothetical protein